MELKRAPEGWRGRGWGKEEMERGESGSSYVVWEASYQPTLFTSQMPNVSFCKALCMFWGFFFCLIHQKNTAETPGEREEKTL